MNIDKICVKTFPENISFFFNKNCGECGGGQPIFKFARPLSCWILTHFVHSEQPPNINQWVFYIIFLG